MLDKLVIGGGDSTYSTRHVSLVLHFEICISYSTRFLLGLKYHLTHQLVMSTLHTLRSTVTQSLCQLKEA